jgi:phenylalanyl-tRNA synthetase beta chain
LENASKIENINTQVESNNCKAYINILLKNIEVKKSKFLDRLNLVDLGESSINNWIDFSNIFMFLTGQPIHFFDADKIK